MREEVIPYTIAISRLGQKAYFQIPLPKYTKRIIGLEFGMLPDQGPAAVPPSPAIDPYFLVLPNVRVGKIVLQVPDRAGVFYQGDIVKDSNIHLGQKMSSLFFPPTLWTHGQKKEEITVQVANADFVEGIFWNEKEDAHPYALHIYVWIEKCDP